MSSPSRALDDPEALDGLIGAALRDAIAAQQPSARVRREVLRQAAARQARAVRALQSTLAARWDPVGPWSHWAIYAACAEAHRSVIR